MSDAEEQIHEILRKAYQIEVDGYTFYSMVADQASKPAVGELFEKLAKDEVQHQAYLKGVMSSYDERGVEAFGVRFRNPDLKAFTATLFTDRFKEQASGATFELGVLSVGMTLETKAIEYFSNAAATAGEREVREFYEYLADWERQHLEALRLLYDGVRQDHWADGGFAPF